MTRVTLAPASQNPAASDVLDAVLGALAGF